MDSQTQTSSLIPFVIGPIGDKDAPDGSPSRLAYEEGIQVFEEVISPACLAFGLEASRADMISRAGEIPEQIFRQLRDASVVIADLTGANPNVMYELGLRHTTGKMTIQIGEKDRLPFDVAAIRTIMFKRTAAGLVQARKDLSKALAANLDSGGDPVTATRIWFEPATNRALEQPSHITPAGFSEAEDDGPGFLELLADMEDGTQSLVQTLATATSISENIAAIYAEGSGQVRTSDAMGGGAGARLAIAERVASKLNEQASRMEIVSGEYSNTVSRMEPGIAYVFDRLAEDPSQLADMPNFAGLVKRISQASKGSIKPTLNLKETVVENGKMSRSMKRVGRRLAASLQNFALTSGRIAQWEGLASKTADDAGGES